MAILPQIDNSMTNQIEFNEYQLPSKTYKLNVNESNDLIYSEDASNIVTFKIIDGNLIAIPQSEDREIDFEIENNDLIAISDNEKILSKYSIVGNYLVLDSTYYSDRIIGYIDNLEAIKQAIYHILMTERYAYLIYDDNYGVELEQYVGKDLEYIEATIEDTLREALTYDLRIEDITVNSITNVEKDKVLINFTASTIYGDLILEVNINV